jgi:hypothetical protein
MQLKEYYLINSWRRTGNKFSIIERLYKEEGVKCLLLDENYETYGKRRRCTEEINENYKEIINSLGKEIQDTMQHSTIDITNNFIYGILIKVHLKIFGIGENW